jgi:hypothetical protein
VQVIYLGKIFLLLFDNFWCRDFGGFLVIEKLFRGISISQIHYRGGA